MDLDNDQYTIDENDSDSQLLLKKDLSKQYLIIYLMFLGVSLLTNYDSGVVPVSISAIQKEMNISYTAIAALGSLNSLGNSLGSLLLPVFFINYQANKVLFYAGMLNCIFCVIFALFSNLWIMDLSRVFMGIFQAVWTAYCPIWINGFAPSQNASLWIGLQQGITPLGVMWGYMTSTIVLQYVKWIHAWRISVIIQAVLLLPIIIIMNQKENHLVDILHDQKLDNTKQQQIRSRKGSQDFLNSPLHSNNLRENLLQLWNNRVYSFVIIAQVSAFFVSSAVQFWGIQCFKKIFQLSQIESMMLVSSTMLTAPVIGVVLGGYILDQFGGYKGKNMKFAIKMALIQILLATLTSSGLGFTKDVYKFTAMLWIGTVFGSSIVPPCIGISIASLKKNMQPFGQSISQFSTNFFGFFLSPMLSAYVIDQQPDNITAGLQYGLICLSCIFLLGSCCLGISLLCFDQFQKDNQEIFEIQN